VREFGYRIPRVAFPLSFRLEMVKPSMPGQVEMCGIDISARGIAVALNDQVALNETVELVIRTGTEEVARIPGRAFYQSASHFGFVFEFSSDEQREQIQTLVSRLVTTI